MERNRDNAYRGNRPPGGATSPGSPIDDARETIRDTADSVGATIGSIIEDLQGIVRGEVQLAKTELKEEAGQMGRGAGMVGAGVLFGLVGFIFLMLAVTYLLAEWVEMWIAAGIVALVLLVVAAILAMSGKNQISDANLTPDQTIDSLKEDKEWASRQMNSVKK
jgi:uncharacterized membrane protein YqjE